MGTPREPNPVKLFIGMLTGDPALFGRCTDLLSGQYGPVEMESPVRDWSYSDYYGEEIGAPLFRKFIAFRQVVDPATLASTKLRTNSIEASLALGDTTRMRRTINLDPGYVAEAKVVLATTKDYAHRIYIGDGIYAEVTLLYRKAEQGFIALDHTYPDFCSAEVRQWFLAVRERLRAGLAAKTP